MDFDKLWRLRRAAAYAAIEYAKTHPGQDTWVLGELGLLRLEAVEDKGEVCLEPVWSFIQPTPPEIRRAVERAKRREA
jgi:hypothetical protein